MICKIQIITCYATSYEHAQYSFLLIKFNRCLAIDDQPEIFFLAREVNICLQKWMMKFPLIIFVIKDNLFPLITPFKFRSEYYE